MATDKSPTWLELFADALKPAQVVGIDPLRKWSLSQVFRLTLDEGRTLIAKRGIPTKGPTELEIYQECLIPLEIDAPTVVASFSSETEYAFLMEDLQGADLEQRPSNSDFLDAARRLAEIRTSAEKIAEFNTSKIEKHLLTKEQLLLDLEYVLEHAGREHQEMISSVARQARSVAQHLDRLYEEMPPTLNHNDYHAKNLLNVGGRVVPIDWANARISPHLGDLCCLIAEGRDQGIPQQAFVDTYTSTGTQEKVTDWHLDVGSLCWHVHSLQWILEFGLDAIPSSKNWVANYLADISATVARLEP